MDAVAGSDVGVVVAAVGIGIKIEAAGAVGSVVDVA